MPDMLWVEVRQSSYPQARTLSIDTEKAKKRIDVKVIITPDDVHDAKYGALTLYRGILARRRICIPVKPVAPNGEDTPQINSHKGESRSATFPYGGR